ncbi:MAG TPA: TetR/AcrR family transcriptional regulator [Prolixibacteraceae bacterium]|nr:TetR/AcrR family transcriptional regulator [Prolixibacteraceae bacterium]
MELRERIISEAGKLFVARGVRQVTMDTIAQEMGISKRTIYENFKDKNDLLQNILTEATLQHKKNAIEIMNKADNVILALFAFGEYNRETFSKINPLFFDEMKKYHPQVFQSIMNNGAVRNYELTYTVLKRGVNEGIFLKEINLDIANLFIHYLLDFFQKPEVQEICNHVEIFKSVHLPYLRGLCTDKGIDLLKKIIEKYENSEIN